MPPKALITTLLTVVITLGISEDVSMSNVSLNFIIVGQLQEIVNQLIENNIILKSYINGIGAAKVKLSLVKCFLGDKTKLKGFLV